MKLAGTGRFAVRMLALASLFASGLALANPEPWDWNLTKGATQTSLEVYQLHMLGFYVCIGIGVLVFGAMFIAMFRFRKSRGAVAEKWSHNTKLEVVWTIVPVLLLIILAWPATTLLVDMTTVGKAEMTVKVTGYQWLWEYDYLSYKGAPVEGVGFVSRLDKASNMARQLDSGIDPWSVKDNGYNSYLLNVDKPLVLPTDTRIRFVVTAEDVIHSWWVPALGFKTDAIPGIVNESWTVINEPGLYRGQCAELCGQDHGFMPVVVKAVPPAEFSQWLQGQQSQAQVDSAAQTAQANVAAGSPRS